MTHTLVIGYGNSLRSDDGLGWHAAQHLAQLHEANGVKVVACHQLTPELAKPLSEADYVAFIDATWVENPGEIRGKTISPEPINKVVWNHVMNPITLLSYTQHLYHACPKAVVFSVGGQSFDFGEVISDPVANALPNLFARIGAWLTHPEREVA